MTVGGAASDAFARVAQLLLGQVHGLLARGDILDGLVRHHAHLVQGGPARGLGAGDLIIPDSLGFFDQSIAPCPESPVFSLGAGQGGGQRGPGGGQSDRDDQGVFLVEAVPAPQRAVAGGLDLFLRRNRLFAGLDDPVAGDVAELRGAFVDRVAHLGGAVGEEAAGRARIAVARDLVAEHQPGQTRPHQPQGHRVFAHALDDRMGQILALVAQGVPDGVDQVLRRQLPGQVAQALGQRAAFGGDFGFEIGWSRIVINHGNSP